MENKNDKQSTIVKYTNKEKIVELFKIITLILTFLLIILTITVPCIELNLEEGANSTVEVLEEISQDKDLIEKFNENADDLTDSQTKPYTDIIYDMVQDRSSGKNSEESVKMGILSFGWETIYKGMLEDKVFTSVNNKFNSFIVLFVSVFYIVIPIVFIALLIFISISICIKSINLISNYQKINDSKRKTFKKIQVDSVLVFLIFCIVLMLPLFLFKIPSAVASFPSFGLYMMFFSFTPVFYVLLAAGVILLISHIVFKIIKNGTMLEN